jgi:DNA polymerase gamma 1
LLLNYPEWYRDLCLRHYSDSWRPGPVLITTQTQITPKLMRLTWNGYPIHHLKDQKWGYLVPISEYNEIKKMDLPTNNTLGLIEYNKRKEIINHSLKTKKNDLIMVNDKIFMKIPHKNGDNNQVGSPLTKYFIQKIEDGVLSSTPKDLALKSVKFHNETSYYGNNEKRIKAQKAILFYKDENDKAAGAILPITVVSGTITRRAVEATWLTASGSYKPDRIGGELKTMLQAPAGYCFVGADVDSQELWIASLIGDSNFTKIHGSTALGWMTLLGNKNDGTDMHSRIASLIGISRDQAKVLFSLFLK